MLFRSENGTHTETLETDCRKWVPGEVTAEDTVVRPEIPAGSYGVEIALFEGERPIELALKQDLRKEDGFYRIGKTEVR